MFFLVQSHYNVFFGSIIVQSPSVPSDPVGQSPRID